MRTDDLPGRRGSFEVQFPGNGQAAGRDDLFQRRIYPGICPEIKTSETILGVDQYLPAVNRRRTADQEA